MDSTKDITLKLIISMLYDTACRRSEILKIRFKDIEPIKEPKNNIYAKVRIMGKGHKSREVYLNETTFNLLKEYGKGKKKSDYIIRFKSNDNKEIKFQDHKLWEVLSKHIEPILGRNFHCHMLRHTFATHMADNGAHAEEIMYYLGHKEVSTTLIYIEISTFMGERAFTKYSKDILE
jgi:integrase/recombinase XerC